VYSRKDGTANQRNSDKAKMAANHFATLIGTHAPGSRHFKPRERASQPINRAPTNSTPNRGEANGSWKKRSQVPLRCNDLPPGHWELLMGKSNRTRCGNTPIRTGRENIDSRRSINRLMSSYLMANRFPAVSKKQVTRRLHRVGDGEYHAVNDYPHGLWLRRDF